MKKFQQKIKYKKKKCLQKLLIYVRISLIIGWIGKFVLFILLIYYKDKGDTQKYEDFIKCRNFRKQYFEKITRTKLLRQIFDGFFAISIISESFEKIHELIGIAMIEFPY